MNRKDLRKQAGTGYLKVPTFGELRQAVMEMPDATEDDVKELQAMGLINQAQMEELVTIVHEHKANENFKTAPYDNFGYNGQQGPLNSSQTIQKEAKMKKSAAEEDEENPAEPTVEIDSQNITVYTLYILDAQGKYVDSFRLADILGIKSIDLDKTLCQQFKADNIDSIGPCWDNQANAQKAADYIIQKMKEQK